MMSIVVHKLGYFPVTDIWTVLTFLTSDQASYMTAHGIKVPTGRR
jgi:hypothetical protein